jgi:hypothetical protein
MKSTSEFAAGDQDDELIERWFDETDWAAVPEVDPETEVGEMNERRPRLGMLIAAVSATAFALVLIVATRI